MCDGSDKEEHFEHFMSCKSYGNSTVKTDWKTIFENDADNQYEVAKEVKRRIK